MKGGNPIQDSRVRHSLHARKHFLGARRLVGVSQSLQAVVRADGLQYV